MDQLWAFARDWYGSYLDRPRIKRTAAETRELLARHGLEGDFWNVGPRE